MKPTRVPPVGIGLPPHTGRGSDAMILPARSRTVPPVALLLVVVLAVLTGCGRLMETVLPISVFNPVWAADGWIYHLREESSNGKELWRRHPDRSSSERVLDRLPDGAGCRGVLSFLYPARGSDVGVAVECGRGMELLTYDTARGTVTRRASLPFLGGAALTDGEATGYVEVPRGCGLAVERLVRGDLRPYDHPVTVAGATFDLAGADHGCESAAQARSPTVAGDGRLFLVVAPDQVGKGPMRTADPEDFAWHLVEWTEADGAARSLTPVPGLADLAVSPDGRTVVVAVGSPAETAGVWVVDGATGKKKAEIVDDVAAYHPSISPDGTRVVYVADFRQLRVADL